MAAEGTIVDLDALVPADKRIAFRGKTFTVPGDLPLVTYLKLNRMAGEQEDGVTESALLDNMIEALVQLFAWKLPEDHPDRLWLDGEFRGLGLETVTNMIATIYPADTEPEEDPVPVDDPDPPQAPDGETTTTTS